MSIKIILVPIGGNKGSMTALNRAFVVAGRFGAHIKGLHVMGRVTDAVSFEFHLPAKLRGSVQASAEQAALAKADEARVEFEAACQQANVTLSDRPGQGDGPSASWHQEFGHVEDILVRHARLSDLVTVPRPVIDGGSGRRSPVGKAIEAMLCGTGRPVLIEPPMATTGQCERIAVGWNESTEASRAIAMTWPWLISTGAVTILSSKKREAGTNALVEYFSWHGITSNVVFLDGKGDSVGEAMLNVCAEEEAGLLAVGGFSHARARELLFGGVTRHLLTHANIPTLMVH
jgi:nucleotide-binding universal stress UspA family protein